MSSQPHDISRCLKINLNYEEGMGVQIKITQGKPELRGGTTTRKIQWKAMQYKKRQQHIPRYNEPILNNGGFEDVPLAYRNIGDIGYEKYRIIRNKFSNTSFNILIQISDIDGNFDKEPNIWHIDCHNWISPFSKVCQENVSPICTNVHQSADWINLSLCHFCCPKQCLEPHDGSCTFTFWCSRRSGHPKNTSNPLRNIGNIKLYETPIYPYVCYLYAMLHISNHIEKYRKEYSGTPKSDEFVYDNNTGTFVYDKRNILYHIFTILSMRTVFCESVSIWVRLTNLTHAYCWLKPGKMAPYKGWLIAILNISNFLVQIIS